MAPRKGPLSEVYRKTRYVAGHRSSKISVSPTPHLDDESLSYFKDKIATVSCYLEYGSGGSTLLAHRHVETLVSVESDRHFLAAVRKALEASPGRAQTVLIPVNIGLTEAWGKPVFTNTTSRRVQRWKAYPRAPWTFFKDRQVEPDLILVDGRFRVACVLESLLNQNDNSDCAILLDDYPDRPHYSVVEEFADLLEMRGRMAVLRRKPSFEHRHCQQTLNAFYSDFR